MKRNYTITKFTNWYPTVKIKTTGENMTATGEITKYGVTHHVSGKVILYPRIDLVQLFPEPYTQLN